MVVKLLHAILSNMKTIPIRKFKKGGATVISSATVNLPTKKAGYNVWDSNQSTPTIPSSFGNPTATAIQTPAAGNPVPFAPVLNPPPSSEGKVFGGATNAAGDNTGRNSNYGSGGWSQEHYDQAIKLDQRQREYQAILNPHLENQAQQSGVPITDKYNGYLTPEKQNQILQAHNAQHGTDYSTDDYNKNVLGGLNDIYSKYRPEGYNLRGGNELGAGSKGNVNLYGYRNYSAKNDFAQAQPAQATPAAQTPAPTPAIGGTDPLAGLNTQPIVPTRFKNRNGVDLSGLAGLAGNFMNPSIKEADKLNLPKLRLEHPVITQPDVDRPIQAMVSQASGILQRNRSTDLASRVAMSGQLQSGVNNGISQVYDNSANFTEGKRAEAIPILNQEHMADFENKKYANVDDVNYQRQRVQQNVAALSAMNNQNAQTAATKRYANEMRSGRNAQYNYQLTGMDYDNKLSEIDNRIKSGQYSREDLDKLSKERNRLENEKIQTMKGIITSSSKGGIVSRYAKGGKVNQMALEDKRQGNRLQMADKNLAVHKQLAAYTNQLQQTSALLKQSQEMVKQNMNLIGKRYSAKMPNHPIPSSYKK